MSVLGEVAESGAAYNIEPAVLLAVGISEEKITQLMKTRLREGFPPFESAADILCASVMDAAKRHLCSASVSPGLDDTPDLRGRIDGTPLAKRRAVSDSPASIASAACFRDTAVRQASPPCNIPTLGRDYPAWKPQSDQPLISPLRRNLLSDHTDRSVEPPLSGSDYLSEPGGSQKDWRYYDEASPSSADSSLQVGGYSRPPCYFRTDCRPAPPGSETEATPSSPMATPRSQQSPMSPFSCPGGSETQRSCPTYAYRTPPYAASDWSNGPPGHFAPPPSNSGAPRSCGTPRTAGPDGVEMSPTMKDYRAPLYDAPDCDGGPRRRFAASQLSSGVPSPAGSAPRAAGAGANERNSPTKSYATSPCIPSEWTGSSFSSSSTPSSYGGSSSSYRHDTISVSRKDNGGLC